jgi:GNAT superfamily N-acetyltransferase
LPNSRTRRNGEDEQVGSLTGDGEERRTALGCGDACGIRERSTEAVELREGYVVGIRAVSLRDGELLRRMFSRLSRESIYQRFHIPYPSVPEWAVALFMGVHESQGKYLVAVAGNEMVGHAMYTRSEDGRPADIGIIVEDEWQHRGIGKLLLSKLAAAARRRCIETFTGVVLAENRPMMRLVTAVFTGVRSTGWGGQYEIYAPLASIRLRGGDAGEETLRGGRRF